MFYVQIFTRNGNPLTIRYGPSTGNTWEQVMAYANFLLIQYGIKVYVKIFDEAEKNGEVA